MEVGKQYSYAGHTVTFAKEAKEGDPLTPSLFHEIDGRKPEIDDELNPSVFQLIQGAFLGIDPEKVDWGP